MNYLTAYEILINQRNKHIKHQLSYIHHQKQSNRHTANRNVK